MAVDAVLPRSDGPPEGLLSRLAQGIGATSRWRRVGLTLLLGLLAAGAMPPFNLVPLLIPSLVGLVWLTDARTGFWGAAKDGWLWSLGFLVPCLYWISLSMFVDIAQFWWAVPFAVLGLPAFLSLWAGAATGLARWIGGTGAARILVFAACWTAGEWLRGHVPFGGFPWVLLGYTWSGDWPPLLAMLQTTSLVGTYGLSFLTVLIAAMPAIWGSPGRPAIPLAAAGILLVGCMAWGGARLDRHPGQDVPGVTLRIIQTDIREQADWSPQSAADNLQSVLALAASPGADKVTAEVWPESSVDFPLNLRADIRAAVSSVVPHGGVVITGALRGAVRDGMLSDVWNSITAIDGSGAVVGNYDKAHLVPFGEYVPLRWLLNINPIVAHRLDLSRGPGPRTLTLPGLPPVGPISCYEAIFPHAVVDPNDRPGWILNATNDSWFGISTGPYQHFAIARVRAVEEGLPLIRTANGGISGVVDAYGRRVETLPLSATGILDVKLPAAIPGHTLYGQSGDILLVLFFLPALLVGGYIIRIR